MIGNEHVIWNIVHPYIEGSEPTWFSFTMYLLIGPGEILLHVSPPSDDLEKKAPAPSISWMKMWDFDFPFPPTLGASRGLLGRYILKLI